MTARQRMGHAEALSDPMAIAIEAAYLAGEVIKAGQQKLLTVGSTSIEQKGIGDLVSQVDRDADEAATRLIASRSDLPILSEELHHDVAEQDDMWIVDPLDASSAYLVQAGPEYPAVLVAMREAGETLLGVTYFPLTGEWFYGQKSRGAWFNGKRLICDTDCQLEKIWVEMNQYGSAELETDYFANLRRKLRSSEGAQLVTTNVPHSGVAMRIAQGDSTLAAAVHDNSPENIKQAAWDIAAPQIILEEAGGVFVDPRGNRTDPFAGEPIIVARSAEVANRIVELGMSRELQIE